MPENASVRPKADSPWIPPDDLDPECLALCAAINEAVPGVVTTSSCCGHGKRPYRIWVAGAFEFLPPLLYALNRCHSGVPGWRCEIYTDCAMSGPFLMIEGPAGAFADAAVIADYLRDG